MSKDTTEDTGVLNYKHCNICWHMYWDWTLTVQKEVWTNLCVSCVLASRFRSMWRVGRWYSFSSLCEGRQTQMLDRCWNTASLDCELWIVCQTQMVFAVKGTHSWIQSPSLQLSLTPVRMRIISWTKPLGLIWPIFIMFCLWSDSSFWDLFVWIAICSAPLQLTKKALLSPFCAGCCFFLIRLFLSSGLVTFLNCCVLLNLSVDQVALIVSSPVHILVVFPFRILPNPNSWCLLLSGLYQLVRSIPVRHTHAVGKAPGFRNGRTSAAFNTLPEVLSCSVCSSTNNASKALVTMVFTSTKLPVLMWLFCLLSLEATLEERIKKSPEPAMLKISKQTVFSLLANFISIYFHINIFLTQVEHFDADKNPVCWQSATFGLLSVKPYTCPALSGYW